MAPFRQKTGRGHAEKTPPPSHLPLRATWPASPMMGSRFAPLRTLYRKNVRVAVSASYFGIDMRTSRTPNNGLCRASSSIGKLRAVGSIHIPMRRGYYPAQTPPQTAEPRYRQDSDIYRYRIAMPIGKRQTLRRSRRTRDSKLGDSACPFRHVHLGAVSSGW